MNDPQITRRTFVAATLVGASLGRPFPARAASLAHGAEIFSTPGQETKDASLAIAGVTVIDATGAPPQPHMTVVIEGERIAEIQPSDGTRTPEGMRVIDGAGRYLILGLWDAHVHTFVFPWQLDLYYPLLIANGVTGIRDMGGAVPMSAIDEFRSAISAGERLGPRIVAGMMVDGPIPVWPFALRAGTAEQGRQAVATVTEARADFVKVYTLLPREAYLAIAEAATERGLPFAGHVPIAVSAAEASDAGQRTIEHYSDSLLPYCSTAEEEVLAGLRAAATGPDPVQAYAAAFFAALPRLLETYDPGKTEALARRFAANQTRFTPTLIIGRNAGLTGGPAQLADPRLRYLPPEVVVSWSPQEDIRREFSSEEDRAIAGRSLRIGNEITQAMQRAGASLLAGTDLGLPFVFPSFSLHDELTLLVQAGLTPLEALQAATRNPAEATGLADDLGTVEVGKLADLVLLEADPLADITNTSRIAAVFANGRLLEKPELQELLRTAERAAARPAA
jgi:imidazolonepropionase-like amidohydrolase